MPQDYYSEWVSWLDKGGAKPTPKPAPKETATAAPAPKGEGKSKDYFAKWSSWLDKQPPVAKEKSAWEGTMKPMLEMVKDELPDSRPRLGTKVRPKEKLPMPSIGEAVQGIQQQAGQYAEQLGMGGFNPGEYIDPKTGGFYRNKVTGAIERPNKPYKSVMEGIGPGGVKEKEKGPGIGEVVTEQAKGLVDFLPDLAVDLVTDPGRALRERPLDFMLAIEGFAGPKVRARITNLKAKMKAGPISTQEMGAIFKDVLADAPNWNVPPEIKAKLVGGLEQGQVSAPAPAPQPSPAPTPVAPPAPTPAPEVAAPQGAEPTAPTPAPSVPTSAPAGEIAVGETITPAKPLNITSQERGMGLDEFERARSTEPTGYAPRKVPGLGIQMVDSKGNPISMADFLAKKNGKNIQAAENLSVALMGANAGKAEAAPPPIPKSAPDIPLTPQQQLVEAAKGAKKLVPEQAEIYAKERGRRMGQFERTSGELAGEAKATARRISQAGKMEKVGWEPIRDKFTPESIDGFFDMIDRHPNLDGFEKLSTETALTKILDGQLPQPAEIDKLAVVFGKDLADTLVAKRDTMSKGMRFLMEAGNLPRSLMASFDLSAPLRQGIFMVSHPKLFGGAFRHMLEYWKDPKAYDALQNSIIQRPNYLLMRKSGLGLTDVQRFMKGREEAFASSWAEKIPGVKASERAYMGFLNKLRADTFDYLIKMADEKGLKPYENTGTSKQIAALVNNATGRGSLKGMGLENAALTLNSVFFSPRLMASRINMLNPVNYIKLPKHVRAWAIKTALADLGIAATTLGAMKEMGADVNLDYNSPDFMKIKLGNTRLDVMGGFGQYYRVIAQSLDFLHKNYIGGEKTGKTALERLGTFFQYKEAPLATLGADILRGKNILGEKFNVGKEISSRLLPMTVQDVADVLRDDPSRFYLVLPGIFGVGVQTYEDKPKKTSSVW